MGGPMDKRAVRRAESAFLLELALLAWVDACSKAFGEPLAARCPHRVRRARSVRRRFEGNDGRAWPRCIIRSRFRRVERLDIARRWLCRRLRAGRGRDRRPAPGRERGGGVRQLWRERCGQRRGPDTSTLRSGLRQRTGGRTVADR